MGENLAVHTFGGLRFVKAGQAITEIGSRKVEALFLYLALADRPQPREMLADLLWNDRSQQQAMANLRYILSGMRKHFGPYLEITRTTAALARGSDLWLDTRELQTRIAPLQERSGVLSPETAARVEEGIDLYQGDFLAGFHIREASGFEAWLTEEREYWRNLVLESAGILAASYEEAGMYPEGIALVRRSLQIDPLEEAIHRRLMALLSASDLRTAAIQQYEHCRKVLWDELGIEPDPETTASYEQIKAGTPVRAKPHAPIIPTPVPAEPPEFLKEDIEEPVPVFVAREGALAGLEPFLARTLAGQGQVAFVVGEAGSGKTALLRAFARRTLEAHPDLLVAVGACSAGAGVGDAYLPFREVLELLVGDLESAWKAGGLTGESAKRLWTASPGTWQALAENGPHLIDTLVPYHSVQARARAGKLDFRWLEQARGNRGRPGAVSKLEQGMLFEEYTRVLLAISAQQPLVLLLDDLQWMDRASVGLLSYLGRRLAGSQVLMLGTYRPDELALGRDGQIHPLGQVLTELKRNRGDILVDLHAVQDTEGQAFVEAFLDTQPNKLPDAFRTALFACTGGHPLFTVELLRAMQERGDLVQDRDGYWQQGPMLDWDTLPARVDGVIEARLNRLPPELREILTVASVEGERFTAEVVARVQEMDQRRVLHLLSLELEKRHRLVQERGEVRVGQRHLSRYRFGHILFQRYLYDNLGTGERRLLHHEIAQALSALYEADPDVIGMELAYHYLGAGEQELAVTHLRRAGDRARQLAALEEAVQFYRKALEHWPAEDQSGRAETLRKLGECQLVTGYLEEALESMEASFTLFQTIDDQLGAGTAQRFIGWINWHQANWEDALKHYQRSLAILERVPESVELARTISAISQMYMLSSEYEQSIIWGERALELSERIDAQDVRIHALNNMGFSHFVLGRAKHGLRMLQDSLYGAQALDMVFDVTRAYFNMAVLLLYSCRHVEARAVLEEMRAYGVRYHVAIGIAGSHFFLAELDWLTGQWSDAPAHIQSLLDILSDVQRYGISILYTSNVLGWMFNDLGQPKAALRELENLLPTARRAIQPQTSGQFLGQLARTYALLGLESKTKTVIEEYFNVFDRSSTADLTTTNHLLFVCQWLAARSAPEALEEAHACLHRLERVHEQVGSPETAACLSEGRGSVAFAVGDYPQAIEHLRDAADRWEAVGRPYDQARALKYLGEVFTKTKDTSGAGAAFGKAMSIVEMLAAQLEEDLRSSFLNSPLVREIRSGLGIES